jgi:hypothetical protein
MIEKGRIRLFQIYYSEETRSLLDTGFTPLDNSDNPRPDWAEYWPIRKLFATNTFDDDDLLGVFSPRFFAKTGITGASMRQALADAGGDYDVYNFSPFFDQATLYRSPYEQGEVHHAGLYDALEDVALHLGVELDFRTHVCDHTTTIFSNYFVARYTTWKVWLGWLEEVFNICERGKGVLAEALEARTLHRHTYSFPMKIFVLERLITTLIETRSLRTRVCIDITTAPTSLAGVPSVFSGLLFCDALKGQYRRTGTRAYLEQYNELRQQLIEVLNKAYADRRAAGRTGQAE